MLNDVIIRTGCFKPCSYKEYKLVGEDPTASIGIIDIQFVKKEIMIEMESLRYSALSLLADMGGSLGMFLGFSFLMVWDGAEAAISKIRHLLRARHDAPV